MIGTHLCRLSKHRVHRKPVWLQMDMKGGERQNAAITVHVKSLNAAMAMRFMATIVFQLRSAAVIRAQIAPAVRAGKAANVKQANVWLNNAKMVISFHPKRTVLWLVHLKQERLRKIHVAAKHALPGRNAAKKPGCASAVRDIHAAVMNVII